MLPGEKSHLVYSRFDLFAAVCVGGGCESLKAQIMNKLMFSCRLVFFDDVFLLRKKAAEAHYGCDVMVGVRSRVTAQFVAIILVLPVKGLNNKMHICIMS